jgi:hypothetical protein
LKKLRKQPAYEEIREKVRALKVKDR